MASYAGCSIATATSNPTNIGAADIDFTAENLRHIEDAAAKIEVQGASGALVFGAPGLIMDVHKSVQAPNGGPYVNIVLPRSRVEAARWVRDHSRPDDIVATNMHCLQWSGRFRCCPRLLPHRTCGHERRGRPRVVRPRPP